MGRRTFINGGLVEDARVHAGPSPSPLDAPPTESPHASNDEFDYANGTNLTSYGWSWANQGTSTASVAAGSVFFTPQSGSNGMRGLFKTPPTGDWSVTAAVAKRLEGATVWSGPGLVLLYGTLSSPTLLVILRRSGGDSQVQFATFTGLDLSGGAQIALSSNLAPYNVASIIRLEHASTGNDITAKVWDNSEWITVGTYSTPTAPPDYVGFAALRDGSDRPCRFDWVRFNWDYDDFDPTRA